MHTYLSIDEQRLVHSGLLCGLVLLITVLKESDQVLDIRDEEAPLQMHRQKEKNFDKCMHALYYVYISLVI